MNWFEILKNSRLSSRQKGKSINIDSVKPIESNDDDDCYQKLIEYIKSKLNGIFSENGLTWDTRFYHGGFRTIDMKPITKKVPDEKYCIMLDKLIYFIDSYEYIYQKFKHENLRQLVLFDEDEFSIYVLPRVLPRGDKYSDNPPLLFGVLYGSQILLKCYRKRGN